MRVLSGPAERLRLLRKDVRVTAKGLRLVGRGVGSNGAGSLVQAMLARYGLKSQHWPRLLLALWRAVPSAGPQLALYRVRLTVTPNLALTVLAQRPPHGVDTPSASRREFLHPWQPGWPGRELRSSALPLARRCTPIEASGSQTGNDAAALVFTRPLASLVQPAVQAVRRPASVPRVVYHARLYERRERTKVEQLVHRLVNRASRLEPGHSESAGTSPPVGQAQVDSGTGQASPSSAPPQRPVPRIVRRPGWVVDKAEAAHSEDRGDWQNPRRLFPAREMGRQPAETPVVDVGYLTRQVMQAIDRHVVANRERMGRI